MAAEDLRSFQEELGLRGRAHSLWEGWGMARRGECRLHGRHLCQEENVDLSCSGPGTGWVKWRELVQMVLDGGETC